jgi:hypothetical protein
MRTKKVDFRTYFSNEAREARALVRRRSMSRFESSGEADMARETDVEQQRRETQAARDERVTRRSLTRWVPASDELAKVRGGDADAGRRLARFANHSPNMQAEALCARFGFEDETAVAIENQQLLEEEAAHEKRQEEAKQWAKQGGEPAERVDDEVTRALRQLKEEARFFHDPRR